MNNVSPLAGKAARGVARALADQIRAKKLTIYDVDELKRLKRETQERDFRFFSGVMGPLVVDVVDTFVVALDAKEVDAPRALELLSSSPSLAALVAILNTVIRNAPVASAYSIIEALKGNDWTGYRNLTRLFASGNSVYPNLDYMRESGSVVASDYLQNPGPFIEIFLSDIKNVFDGDLEHPTRISTWNHSPEITALYVAVATIRNEGSEEFTGSVVGALSANLTGRPYSTITPEVLLMVIEGNTQTDYPFDLLREMCINWLTEFTRDNNTNEEAVALLARLEAHRKAYPDYL